MAFHHCPSMDAVSMTLHQSMSSDSYCEKRVRCLRGFCFASDPSKNNHTACAEISGFIEAVDCELRVER